MSLLEQKGKILKHTIASPAEIITIKNVRRKVRKTPFTAISAPRWTITWDESIPSRWFGIEKSNFSINDSTFGRSTHPEKALSSHTRLDLWVVLYWLLFNNGNFIITHKWQETQWGELVNLSINLSVILLFHRTRYSGRRETVVGERGLFCHFSLHRFRMLCVVVVEKQLIHPNPSVLSVFSLEIINQSIFESLKISWFLTPSLFLSFSLCSAARSLSITLLRLQSKSVESSRTTYRRLPH